MLLIRRPDYVLLHLWVLRSCVRYRQRLVFSWLLVLHLVYGDRVSLKTLARHGPEHLAFQYNRRLLGATSWDTETLLWWFADQALQASLPPEDGVLSLVVDSTLKGTRGPKHPVAQKTRLRTWKFTYGKALKALVTHLPRWW
jgi:hypothetical protein